MADVRATRDRGQLILVTGVVLAVALVGLALVLNSVIFTENLATRNNEQQSNGMLSERANAKTDFDEAITHVNNNVSTSSNFSKLEYNLAQVVEAREQHANRRAALGGGVVNYSVTSASSGTLIRQTNLSRNFTAGNQSVGEDDWYVVNDTKNVGHFRLTANRGSLYESAVDTTKAGLAQSAFNVNVTDANGDTWRVYLFRGVLTNNVYVLVENPGEDFENKDDVSTDAYVDFVTEVCSYSNDTVTVWMTEAIIQDSRCDQLEFFEQDAVRPLTIRYDNAYDEGADAPRIRGTYELLVERQVDPDPYYTSDDGKSPFTELAITEANVQMHYQGQQTEYYTDIETQAGGITRGLVRNDPEVVTWSIEDDQSDTLSGVKYVMDWSVSDEDGDLEQVELILTETSFTGSTIDRETIDVSGDSASGTTTLEGSPLLVSDDYRLEIIVTDEEGGAENALVTDEADGNP